MAGRPHVGDGSFSDFDYGAIDRVESEFVWRDKSVVAAPDDYRFSLNHPGEPIHTPRRRGSSMGRAFVVCMVLCACGWGAFQTEEMWRPYMSSQLTGVMAALERGSQSEGQPEKLQAQVSTDLNPMQPSEPIATREIADAPGATETAATGHADAGAAKSQADTNSAQDSSSTAADAKPEQPSDDAAAGGRDDAARNSDAVASTEVTPLPPPIVDPADPFQKRALAVGLHPELSRALLSRLSDADYRNAGIAIQKAVSEIKDGGKFIWPRQREPKLALFKVHFVAGAAPDCRRYVVVVTKDGWSTTAQPMERCGVKRTRHSAL